MICFVQVQTGEQFIVEMQRDKQRNFKDRAVFYASRLINEQWLKGKSHWNIDLKEVYFIGILDFCLEDSDSDSYLHNVSLSYKGTGNIFYNKLFYKFIELPGFDKTEAELETDLDRWLYLLKHMSHLEKVPLVFDKDIFQRAFEIAEIVNLNKEEKDMFDFGIRGEWDYKNVMDYAKEESAHKKSQELARGMKEEGLPIHQIVKITKLPIPEIARILGLEKTIKRLELPKKKKDTLHYAKEESAHKKSFEIASKMKEEGFDIALIGKLTNLPNAEIEML